MAPGLEDEDGDEAKDDEQEKKDALPPACVLLVPVGGMKDKKINDQTLIGHGDT
jgi:hypothetical protein